MCLVVTDAEKNDLGLQWFIDNRYVPVIPGTEKFFICVEYLVNLMFRMLKWGCEYTHSYHSCVNNCSSGAAGMKFLQTSDLEGNNMTVTLSTVPSKFPRGL